MERGDIYRASKSLRATSSPMGRNHATTMDEFSRSPRDEDDEESLKWAALEILPTMDRLGKGILTASRGGGADEIDIQNLGSNERKILMERLVRVAEEDNENFLLKLKNRVERVGIYIPTIEVRFEHLIVEAEAHEGDRALPTFITFCTSILEGFLNFLRILPSRKKHLIILQDISGSSNLADMLSELSRREKAANIKPDTDVDIFMKINVGVWYFLRTRSSKILQAAATEGQEAHVVTDYILKVLGLEICSDTMVGDEILRGISGGQRKRVTTGEMLVGPSKALFMDEISTGLDSLMTYQIVNFLKQFIHIFEGTAVISLLQPAPETYDLFDDIILLSDGQVTSRKDQHQYWVCKEEPYTFVMVKEFAEAFWSFHVGRKLGDELSTPFDKSKNNPAALTTKTFGVGMKDLLKACISREYLLMKRNSFVYIFKITQLVIMAFIMMTLFLRTKMHRDSVTDGGVYIGALFFTVTMLLLNGMANLSMTIAKLPVFYKQRDLLFYPAWAYAFPTWILKIPITFVEVAVWVFITYYVIGYDPNVGRLFKQYLLLVVVNQMAFGLF